MLRRTWNLLRAQRLSIALAVVLVVAQAAGTVAVPAAIRYGIDAGVRRRDLGALDLAALAALVGALVSYAAGWGAVRVVARVGERFLREMRERVFAHQIGLSLDHFDRHRTGAVVSRLTADIEVLQELVAQSLTTFVVSALLMLGVAGAMVVMSWELAFAVGLVAPLVLWVTVWFRRESNKVYVTVREHIASTLAVVAEGLAGIKVIQAFRREGAFLARFDESNEEQYGAYMKGERLAAVFFPTIEAGQGIAIAAVLGLGGVLAARDAITVGTVAAFVLYAQNLFEPVQALSQVVNTLQSSRAALHQLFAVLDEAPTVGELDGAVALPSRGDLVVSGVSFRYGGPGLLGGAAAYVLEDVSIVVEAGERLALVGPTGAGKSTLAKLMARLYDPMAGSVSYGGTDLRDTTGASLRERIVVVPQEGFLFSGTIADNLRLGRPSASDSELNQAIDRLGLGSRFAALAGGSGLGAPIRERGANLSAGERQLVSLVRAALADPAVLVLDEATSSLDPGTERLVEQAMEQLMEGRTVVVVAHRLSTSERADRVAVVDGGRIVEHGSHDDLITRGGAYSRLFQSWSTHP